MPTGALVVTGPTGLGQVDDAVRLPRADQPARDQRHHGRGSGRVPARRRQPGADQRPRGPHLRLGAALDPALGPGRRHGRRDPRRRDGEDLDRGRAHGPLRALDAAHERRAVHDHAPGDMGVEPFLTGAAISAVLAQRLARKLCTHCCEAYQPSEAEFAELRSRPTGSARSTGPSSTAKRAAPGATTPGTVAASESSSSSA